MTNSRSNEQLKENKMFYIFSFGIMAWSEDMRLSFLTVVRSSYSLRVAVVKNKTQNGLKI